MIALGILSEMVRHNWKCERRRGMSGGGDTFSETGEH